MTCVNAHELTYMKTTIGDNASLYQKAYSFCTHQLIIYMKKMIVLYYYDLCEYTEWVNLYENNYK